MSALALAGVLLLSGVGLAATRLVGGQSAETQGRKIALQAVRDTAALPACSRARPSSSIVLSDAAPLPAITATLPALGVPVPSPDRERALAVVRRLPTGGTLLRRTVRSIALPSEITLVVYVEQGLSFGGVRDPAACLAARRERAAALAEGRPEAVARWAQRRLGQLTDTAPGLQTLNVLTRVSGQSGFGGIGIAVRPGHPPRPGVVGSLGGKRRGVYTGIADVRAAGVTVRDRHGRRIAHAPAEVPVRQGFYALVLPSGTGPVRLREVDGAGTTLRTIALRR